MTTIHPRHVRTPTYPRDMHPGYAGYLQSKLEDLEAKIKVYRAENETLKQRIREYRHLDQALNKESLCDQSKSYSNVNTSAESNALNKSFNNSELIAGERKNAQL